MSDWQIGDLALCIDASPSRFGVEPKLLVLGRIYEVRRVRPTPGGADALYFGGEVLCISCGDLRGWRGTRFIKVTPPTADEFDREVIQLMAGKPVKAPA